jgi:hypothetical protein
MTMLTWLPHGCGLRLLYILFREMILPAYGGCRKHQAREEVTYDFHDPYWKGASDIHRRDVTEYIWVNVCLILCIRYSGSHYCQLLFLHLPNYTFHLPLFGFFPFPFHIYWPISYLQGFFHTLFHFSLRRLHHLCSYVSVSSQTCLF